MNKHVSSRLELHRSASDVDELLGWRLVDNEPQPRPAGRREAKGDSERVSRTQESQPDEQIEQSLDGDGLAGEPPAAEEEQRARDPYDTSAELGVDDVDAEPSPRP